MIIKSYILESNLKSVINKKVFLFYGENSGLKKDLKKKIKNEFKNAGILNLFQDDILKNHNLLVDEIKNKSLFDEKRIIFIDQADDKILEIIENILADITEENIFIFAELLDKRSKLRTFFEKSKDLGVSPCYQDNEITIRNIITKKLNGLEGLSSEIINLIIKNTNLDRNKVNNEVDKIISCFNNKRLEINMINGLLNNETSEDFNLLKDEALNGNKDKTNKLLADTVFQNENIFFYLNLINQRINKLKQIDLLRKDQINIEAVIENLKPPVFWKDKPMLLMQAKKWDTKKINEALKKTYKVEIEIKTNNAINKELLIKNLIVELCSEVNFS